MIEDEIPRVVAHRCPGVVPLLIQIVFGAIYIRLEYQIRTVEVNRHVYKGNNL